MDRYSYRADPSVPPFDDGTPIVIFDGLCVLCSTGVDWMIRHDSNGNSHFAVIQDAVPQALYRHYGLDAGAFDTFMVLQAGLPHTKWDGLLTAAGTMPQPWRGLGTLGRALPGGLGDRVYDWVQRHRLGWFGSRSACRRPTECERTRFLIS